MPSCEPGDKPASRFLLFPKHFNLTFRPLYVYNLKKKMSNNTYYNSVINNYDICIGI